MTSIEGDFQRACICGNGREAVRLLRQVTGADVPRLVERIGGPRAMVRFLVQRRHVLRVPATAETTADGLHGWLCAHLNEAEPMHLLNVQPALAHAQEAQRHSMVRRLEKHLKFIQPADPTRWSRRVHSQTELAFLTACRGGDVEAMQRAVAADEAVVHTLDRQGRDGLTLVARSTSEAPHEAVLVLCTAGIRKRAQPLQVAAERGAPEMLNALLAQDLPVEAAPQANALWFAARGTASAEADLQSFESIVRRLLDAGADVNGVDRWGTTAWGVASPVARAVLESLGAEPVERGKARYDRETGCSAVMLASMQQPPTGDPSDFDLNEAAAAGAFYQLKLLLEVQRPPPNRLRERYAERPLHLAAYFGRAELIHLLIAHGYSPGEVNEPLADGHHVGPKDSWNKSAVQIAAERGHEDVLTILMNSVDFFQGRRARRK